jgi:stress response protein YsnF/sporulation protein YlmC with PRC-barrel domain
MLSSDDVQRLVGADAYGADGEKIGTIGQVFLDDQTGDPVFATVNTGLFGMSENFVPLAEAAIGDGSTVDVGFDRDRVKGAPHVSPDGGHLSPEEEQTLYDYYGLTYASDSGYDDAGGGATYERTVESQPVADDDAMTRSEERLRVGKRREVSGRARLRKYVVTENVTVTVPVRREKAVLESVPAGEEADNDILTEGIAEGAPATGEQPEIILHEEVPVVETVVKPVERVRLGSEEFTTEETVTEPVREERIEVTGDVADAANVADEGDDTFHR